jgi:hypothetical protein
MLSVLRPYPSRPELIGAALFLIMSQRFLNIRFHVPRLT